MQGPYICKYNNGRIQNRYRTTFHLCSNLSLLLKGIEIETEEGVWQWGFLAWAAIVKAVVKFTLSKDIVCLFQDSLLGPYVNFLIWRDKLWGTSLLHGRINSVISSPIKTNEYHLCKFIVSLSLACFSLAHSPLHSCYLFRVPVLSSNYKSKVIRKNVVN